MQLTDGGWLKAHPIPSDKGVFGNFEALAQQNRRVLQDILTSDEVYMPRMRDVKDTCTRTRSNHCIDLSKRSGRINQSSGSYINGYSASFKNKIIAK